MKLMCLLCACLSKHARNVQWCTPNLHSVCNIVIMFQTVVIFLGREKCWVLATGRRCCGSHAKFSFIQFWYHLISPQRCQCCVNIARNSDVKPYSTSKYIYVLGQWMGVRLTYIIQCNFIFHVKIFQILSLDLFPWLYGVIFCCVQREYVQKYVLCWILFRLAHWMF